MLKKEIEEQSGREAKGRQKSSNSSCLKNGPKLAHNAKTKEENNSKLSQMFGYGRVTRKGSK